MKLPNMMYKCPGTHQCPGGTFDYLPVTSPKEVVEAEAAGWWPTIELAQQRPIDYDWGALFEAVGASESELEPEPESELEKEVGKFEPPTREELETKAKELGIGFNKNTKDGTLLEKIEARLAEDAAAAREE